MKKILSMLLILSMFLTASAATAEGMGVQVIGGPAAETESVSLDDFKLNSDVAIEGYGIICGTSFEIADRLGYYRQGKNEPYWLNYYRDDFYQSGPEADYVIVRMDITNTMLGSHDFLASTEVKAVYDEKYEYAGWAYQSNYGNEIAKTDAHGADSEKQNLRWVVNEADQFPVEPMYTGHYVFGCTLPNSIINRKESLKLIITIDGNEITYNIRK